MKISVIKRTLLAGATGVLVLAFVAAPAFAAPFEPCPPPVYGDDGQPVTFECIPVVDTVAPVVNIFNPDTATVRRNTTVLVTAFAYDNVGVSSVEIYVDGVLVSTGNGSGGATSWTPTEKGVHELSAKAYDAAGNVGTTLRLVTVK